MLNDLNMCCDPQYGGVVFEKHHRHHFLPYGMMDAVGNLYDAPRVLVEKLKETAEPVYGTITDADVVETPWDLYGTGAVYWRVGLPPLGISRSMTLYFNGTPTLPLHDNCLPDKELVPSFTEALQNAPESTNIYALIGLMFDQRIGDRSRRARGNPQSHHGDVPGHQTGGIRDDHYFGGFPWRFHPDQTEIGPFRFYRIVANGRTYNSPVLAAGAIDGFYWMVPRGFWFEQANPPTLDDLRDPNARIDFWFMNSSDRTSGPNYLPPEQQRTVWLNAYGLEYTDEPVICNPTYLGGPTELVLPSVIRYDRYLCALSYCCNPPTEGLTRGRAGINTMEWETELYDGGWTASLFDGNPAFEKHRRLWNRYTGIPPEPPPNADSYWRTSHTWFRSRASSLDYDFYTHVSSDGDDTEWLNSDVDRSQGFDENTFATTSFVRGPGEYRSGIYRTFNSGPTNHIFEPNDGLAPFHAIETTGAYDNQPVRNWRFFGYSAIEYLSPGIANGVHPFDQQAPLGTRIRAPYNDNSPGIWGNYAQGVSRAADNRVRWNGDALGWPFPLDERMEGPIIMIRAHRLMPNTVSPFGWRDTSVYPLTLPPEWSGAIHPPRDGQFYPWAYLIYYRCPSTWNGTAPVTFYPFKVDIGWINFDRWAGVNLGTGATQDAAGHLCHFKDGTINDTGAPRAIHVRMNRSLPGC